MWARSAMCQSADCQLVVAGNPMAGARENKENFDWNNNQNNNNNNMFGNEFGVSNNALRDERCQCMMQRRTRRRHPATIQTPGRQEVGDVILEPLVPSFSGSRPCIGQQDADYYSFPSPAHTNQNATTAFSPAGSSSGGGYSGGGGGFWNSGNNRDHSQGGGGWPSAAGNSAARPIGSSRSSSLPIPLRNNHIYQQRHQGGGGGFFASAADPKWQGYEEYEEKESGSVEDASSPWPTQFKPNVLH